MWITIILSHYDSNNLYSACVRNCELGWSARTISLTLHFSMCPKPCIVLKRIDDFIDGASHRNVQTISSTCRQSSANASAVLFGRRMDALRIILLISVIASLYFLSIGFVWLLVRSYVSFYPYNHSKFVLKYPQLCAYIASLRFHADFSSWFFMNVCMWWSTEIVLALVTMMDIGD